MTDPVEQSGEPSVTARLKKLLREVYGLIDNASEARQRALLKLFEAWRLQGLLGDGRTDDRRKHSRDSPPMAVNVATEDRVYKDFVGNISAGGVFIETGEPFSVGQQVTLIFSSPNHLEPIKITGKVIRSVEGGIGVEFEGVSEDLDTIIKFH